MLGGKYELRVISAEVLPYHFCNWLVCLFVYMSTIKPFSNSVFSLHFFNVLYDIHRQFKLRWYMTDDIFTSYYGYYFALIHCLMSNQ